MTDTIDQLDPADELPLMRSRLSQLIGKRKEVALEEGTNAAIISEIIERHRAARVDEMLDPSALNNKLVNEAHEELRDATAIEADIHQRLQALDTTIDTLQPKVTQLANEIHAAQRAKQLAVAADLKPEAIAMYRSALAMLVTISRIESPGASIDVLRVAQNYGQRPDMETFYASAMADINGEDAPAVQVKAEPVAVKAKPAAAVKRGPGRPPKTKKLWSDPESGCVEVATPGAA